MKHYNVHLIGISLVETRKNGVEVVLKMIMADSVFHSCER